MSDPDAGFGRFLIEYQFGNDRYSFVLPARLVPSADRRRSAMLSPCPVRWAGSPGC